LSAAATSIAGPSRGISAAADEVILTNGCSEAVYLALKALEIPSHPREGINLDVLRFALAHLLESLGRLPAPRLQGLRHKGERDLLLLLHQDARGGGGILVWVELPQGLDADALFEAALREDILFAPGSIFSASGGFRGFLRLNGSLAGSEAERAVRRIGELAGGL